MPRRIAGRLLRMFRSALEHPRLIFMPTYTQAARPEVLARHFGFLGRVFLERIQADSPGYADVLRRQAEQILAHRFDLLGSGPVVVAHGVACAGLEGHVYKPSMAVVPDPAGRWLTGRINRANLTEAKRIWSLVDAEYMPIDWQLDFKSGYRWSERSWYRDIPYKYGPGVDLKVPWELARMQHLPHLALAQILESATEPGLTRYAREFRNQILDFVATNPPGFGVNWRCTMEVAIRVANWLLAYELFRANGTIFDAEFEGVFVRSVYEHGRHIIDNLEWLEELHGNHYLADIAGLAFVAVSLPRCEEVDAWLAYAVQELVREVKHQFTEDGANFEASVCYHRLSAEMVLFATALLANLPEEKKDALASYDASLLRTRPPLEPSPIPMYPIPGGDRLTPFPPWYWKRLEKMAEFTMHLTKPDGLVTQFGDNDSGRFIKLGLSIQKLTPSDAAARYLNLAGFKPPLSDEYLDEVHLDHRHLVAAINALFGRPDLAAFAPADTGAWLVSALTRDIRVASYREAAEVSAAKTVRVGSEAGWDALWNHLSLLPAESRRVTIFPAPGADLRSGMELYGYNGFGAYIFRSPRLFLALRCGPIGQSGIGGHAHLDQLAMELVIDGRACVTDPGTYLYTPLPERRNAYRSARAHFVPRLQGREPGNISRNLFSIDATSDGECLYFGPLGFVGRHFGYGEAVYRFVAIEAEQVAVYDFAESGDALEDPTPAVLPFSPGYGKQLHMGYMSR